MHILDSLILPAFDLVIANGERQGGRLSLWFFTVYADDIGVLRGRAKGALPPPP